MIAGPPYDAEVEYLESTGTQWIDTGMVLTVDDAISCGFTGRSSAWNLYIFGAFNGSSYGTGGIALASTPSKFSVVYPTNVSSSTYRMVISYAANERYDIECDRDGLTISGTTDSFSWNQSFVSTRNMYLFALNSGGQASNFQSCRIHYFKVEASGAAVVDFVPVRFTNSNGQSEGAMYDRVSRKLFRNAGTGAFTIGPDVATPVMGLHFMKLPKKTARNYVQDGLVAMWDGIENAGWGVHDNSATTWKDLIGGHVLNVDNGGSWADDCLVCDGTRRGAYGNNLTGGAPLVVEAVVQATTASSWRILWHQGEWRDGLRLTRCLVFYNPTQLWLASAYGYTDVSTTIANKTTIHIDYASSGISHLSINGSDAAFSTGATSWYNTDGGNVFAFGGASSTSANYALACKIYSFRLYSRALTADEIAHNYAVDKERFNLP